MIKGRILFAAAAIVIAASATQASERTDFLNEGAKKLTTPELKELFSGTRFLGYNFNVSNKADGTRIVEVNDYSVTLQWWVNSQGEFCTDTRSGQVWCDFEYFLHKKKLKIFTLDGRPVQSFVVKR